MTEAKRPILAVSAAVFRDGRVLVAQRARGAGRGLWSLPGGAVEWGETLAEAAAREVREETGIEAEIVGLAGEREVRVAGKSGGLDAHYVILCFAARWRAGAGTAGPEVAQVRWLVPEELAGLKTTEGLAEMVAAARRLLG
jgi:ADP-ribose pyrophosphatase YjhB (NUDIX family)